MFIINYDCILLCINDRVWWMYMFVYTLYTCLLICFCMKVEVVFACVCLMNLCCFCIYVWKKCCIVWSHVWMAPGKISCKLAGSPSLNKVFELNWIELSKVGWTFQWGWHYNKQGLYFFYFTNIYLFTYL